MVCISTIDLQTRLDVHELLSHFSHFLDHNQGASWAELFTLDGVFECSDGSRLRGSVDLATVPAKVSARGQGLWRHLITAVMISRNETRKALTVRAYGPVIDMSQSGALAAFYDYEFTLKFTSSWRIASAMAHRVGGVTASQIGAASIANLAQSSISLQ